MSRSRTIIAMASSIGASARSLISSNLPRWKRSSSMAERFLATPLMRRAPIASTRACSTASNTARACCPPGTSLRCTVGSWQASLSAMASAWPRTIAASERTELARRLRQPDLAANDAGALGCERDFELGLLGDRAQATGHRALERLGRAFLAPGFLALEIGGHRLCRITASEQRGAPSSRLQLSATLTELSGNSTPKQR